MTYYADSTGYHPTSKLIYKKVDGMSVGSIYFSFFFSLQKFQSHMKILVQVDKVVTIIQAMVMVMAEVMAVATAIMVINSQRKEYTQY